MAVGRNVLSILANSPNSKLEKNFTIFVKSFLNLKGLCIFFTTAFSLMIFSVKEYLQSIIRSLTRLS